MNILRGGAGAPGVWWPGDQIGNVAVMVGSGPGPCGLQYAPYSQLLNSAKVIPPTFPGWPGWLAGKSQFQTWCHTSRQTKIST